MSHHATNWAVKQRGISPGAKIVLWHLADRHNPDFGCFPSQARLADDCEMSRSSVNNKLAELEKAGLIRRERCFDPKTNRQKSTRYFLAFEEQASRVQDLDTESGAVSKSGAEPCPNSGQSRVQTLDTNLVREPLREPLTRVRASAPDGARGPLSEETNAVLQSIIKRDVGKWRRT